jgi:hypothetical protein
VLEYCAESELHPRSGFGMLKGAEDACDQRSVRSIICLHDKTGSIAPSGRPLSLSVPGVKTPGSVLESLRDMRIRFAGLHQAIV